MTRKGMGSPDDAWMTVKLPRDVGGIVDNEVAEDPAYNSRAEYVKAAVLDFIPRRRKERTRYQKTLEPVRRTKRGA